MFTLTLPKAHKTMQSATIRQWLVAEGDTVKKGDLLAKAETETASLEIASAVDGIVKRILAPQDTTLAVEETMAYIGDPEEDLDAFLSGQSTPESETIQEIAPEEAAAAVVEEVPTGPEGEVVPILMPQAGQSMEEGTIIAWKIKEGDTIEVGQVICEIETDKATMDVEAIDAGRVAKIIAAEGEIIEVNFSI